jgi:predicted ester cyclase
MNAVLNALAERYHDYIDCLNRKFGGEHGGYVDDEVRHNGRLISLSSLMS